MIMNSYGKGKSAIEIFIEHWDKTGEIMGKKDFDEIWQGAAKYYYFVKKKFETYLRAEGKL